MGLLERLGYIRQDSVLQRHWPGITTGKNEPSTFRSSLLVEQIHNKNDLEHLYKVAREDPVARYMVFTLAENTLDDGFKLLDKDGNEVLQEFQKDLRRLNGKHVLIQALAAERWAGWSWVHVVKNTVSRPEGSTIKIAKLDFFNPIDCKVNKVDGQGEPSELKIKSHTVKEGVISSKVNWKKLNAKNFILVRTRPYDRTYRGDPITLSLWDDMTAIRETIGSMVFYDSKIGNGLFVIKLAASPEEGVEGKLEIEVEKFSALRAVALDPEIIDDVDFKGAGAGATDFPSHCNLLLERIASGASVPVDVFTGVSAGAITGSETNVKALFQTINSIQQSFEPTIRRLVELLGYDDSDYTIEWNVRYAHDEEQQTKIEMNRVQTIAMKTWLTVNEKRELDGLKPIEGGEGLAQDKVEWEFNTQGMQTPEEEEKTKNEDGDQL